jgi:hypothetical protein
MKAGARRLWRGVKWVFAAEKPRPQTRRERARRKKPIPHKTLRFCVALSIVIGAASGAAVAWGAERFMEQAAQKEALFRQDVIGQQLSERLDEETVATGLRHFGTYEQTALLADELQREADHARGARASELGTEAQNERMLANVDVTTDNALGSVALPRDGRYVADAASGYALSILNDGTLATFDPTDRHAEAQLARSDAMQMALAAVAFATAVVLFTVSEILLRTETDRPRRRLSIGLTVWISGIGIWVGAAAWALTLVPHLER